MKRILISAIASLVYIALPAQSIIKAEYNTPGAAIKEWHKPAFHAEDGVIKINFIGIDYYGLPSKTVIDEPATTVTNTTQLDDAMKTASHTLFELYSGSMDSFSGSVKYTYHTFNTEERDSLRTVNISSIEKNSRKPYFKLYPTDNIWNFIELDTVTGKLWQVQFSVGEDSQQHRFMTPLNLKDKREGTGTPDLFLPGRFELHKTQNLYNFLLLDTIEGHVWQVQWSTDPTMRFVVPIEFAF